MHEKLVRVRLKKLAQHSLLEHSYRTQYIKIQEAIAFDGIENFARSQYEPNNINQAIGFESQFIYDFNFAPLNRKGRMSDRQKLRKSEIELREGRFLGSSIRNSAVNIFRRLHNKCQAPEGMELYTDEHFQYRKAIQIDLRALKFRHTTISSKATRVYRHILFPVNHTDLLMRHHNKAFTRETISFSKTHGAMIQRYAIQMAWKNYFRPQFVKKHKRNPLANTQSPAMALGLSSKIESFYSFFGRCKMPSQVTLNDEWLEFYSTRHTFPRSHTN